MIWLVDIAGVPAIVLCPGTEEADDSGSSGALDNLAQAAED